MIDDQIIPEDIAAEQAVLGAIMLDKNSIEKIMDVLDFEDFSREAHKVIYKAMVYLYLHDSPVDMVTLVNCLRSRNQLDSVGGIGYITSLNMPTTANICHHAAIIKGKAILRELIRIGKIITNLGYTAIDPDKAIDEAQHYIMGLSINRKNQVPIYTTSIDALFKVSLNQIINGSYAGIKTGFNSLDVLLNGLLPGQLVTLIGSRLCGKTALVLQMMDNIAADNKVVYATCHSIEEAALRLICSAAQVSCWQFKTNTMSDSDWIKLQHQINNKRNSNMKIYKINSNMLELTNKIREIFSTEKMDVLILDIATADLETVNKLKFVADELGISILLVLNMVDIAITLNDVADISLVLSKIDGKHTLEIVKHVGGPTGKIDLIFDKQLLRFCE